jgi:hypothetical protein
MICSLVLGLEGRINPQDQPNRSMLTDDPHAEFSHDICFISFVNEKGGVQRKTPSAMTQTLFLANYLLFSYRSLN